MASWTKRADLEGREARNDRKRGMYGAGMGRASKKIGIEGWGGERRLQGWR